MGPCGLHRGVRWLVLLLVASTLLVGRVALALLLVGASLLPVALMLGRSGERGAWVGFEEMVLHGLQVWEQRCHTLVDDDGVGGVVGRETHPD